MRIRARNEQTNRCCLPTVTCLIWHSLVGKPFNEIVWCWNNFTACNGLFRKNPIHTATIFLCLVCFKSQNNLHKSSEYSKEKRCKYWSLLAHQNYSQFLIEFLSLYAFLDIYLQFSGLYIESTFLLMPLPPPPLAPLPLPPLPCFWMVTPSAQCHHSPKSSPFYIISSPLTSRLIYHTYVIRIQLLIQ